MQKLRIYRQLNVTNRNKIGKFLDSRLEKLQTYLSENKHFIFHLEIRSVRHFLQRIFFGFSDDETYSLFHPIAIFTLPRLKRFRELTTSYSGNVSFEDWQKILDKMIFAFTYSLYEELISTDDERAKELEKELLKFETSKEEWCRFCNEGYELFGKYFANLWW